MPYTTIAELPDSVRSYLTEDEQRQWLTVLNEVYAQTGDETKAMLAAWGAVSKNRFKEAMARYAGVALRSTQAGGYRVMGWGMLFTDADDKDWYGTYFNELTELLLEYYQNAPLFYEHGHDPAYGTEPIGRRALVEVYPFGVWVEHDLNPGHPMYPRTMQEIADGLLHYSGDSILHYVEEGMAQDGNVRAWPAAGWSLVREPAEPGLGPVQLKAVVAALRSIRPQATPLPPAEAHEAQGGSSEARAAQGTIRSSTQFTEDTGMKDKLLKALRSVFKLSADAPEEDVKTAVTGLIDTLEAEPAEEGEAAAMRGIAPDGVRALAQALNLEDGAEAPDVAQALRGVLDILDESEEEPEPQELDLTALSEVATAARGIRQTAMPYMIRPLDQNTGGGGAATRQTGMRGKNVQVMRTREPEVGLIDFICAQCNIVPPRLRGKYPAERAIHRALELGSKGEASAAAVRAITSGPAGGYWLRSDIAQELIRPLYNEPILFKAGARRRQLPAGVKSLTIRKYNAGAKAYWTGEAQSGGSGRGTTDFVSLNLRKLVVLLTRTEEELKFADTGLEQEIMDEIIQEMTLEIDRSGLLGTGAKPDGHVGEEMLGLINAIPAAQIKDLATNGRAPKPQDFTAMKLALRERNIRDEDLAFVVSHRTDTYVSDLTDTTGRRIFGYWTDGAERRMDGTPWYATNQVPNERTVGTTNDNSLIFLGAWKYLYLGMPPEDIEIVADPSRYRETGEVLIRAVYYVDCVVTRDEAFEIRDGVRAQ